MVWRKEREVKEREAKEGVEGEAIGEGEKGGREGGYDGKGGK